MSIYSVKQYQSEVEKIIDFGGTKKETAIRTAFHGLLNEYAKQKGLMLITELSIKGSKGKTVTPDGTLKDSLRQDWGYWESKDEADNIVEEIEIKFNKGYPKENILFEDSNTAILIQQGNEVMRADMKDADALDRIIKEFTTYERPEVENFHKAIELFKLDIPKVTDTIRGIILAEEKTNKKFNQAEESYWELCKESINPEISIDDIREMMIQHILTEEIFNTIFGETQFHRENNIARELEQVILTFFTGRIKHIALASIQHYYQAINAAAAQIADHHEKQKFLKVIYEVFYKGYNPKAADRLGVVYTPNEIVKFMIESTDYLLHHHFGKGLEDKGVEILDPATGTGTFICDIIDYIRKDKLPYKYEHELHANEIAILPYYIANLNIEFTYKQKMGEYKEFESLCFVDTLDNLGFNYAGKQGSLFGGSTENTNRITRQNHKKISVIIGNPPYNANQGNENENNKNRNYPLLDKLIKETFIKFSTAQKIKAYDPYARFYRWAMDRIGDEGIIAFITNNSFVKATGFDGFRKTISNEFSNCYIIDLAGDFRTDKEENVFGIKVGVCITFLIKEKRKETPCRIKYYKLPTKKAKEKLELLSSILINSIDFENVKPNFKNQWLEIGDNDFDTLVSLVSKSSSSKAIINEYSNGLSTNRDEWVYDLSNITLGNKINFFIEEYNNEVERWKQFRIETKYIDIKDESNPVLDSFLSQRNFIKWSKMIKRDKLRKGKIAEYEDEIRKTIYRPFSKKFLYFGYIPIDMKGSFPKFYPHKNTLNKTISISNFERIPLCLLASDTIVDLNIFMPAPCFSFSYYYYNKQNNRIENITDWGLQQFHDHYIDTTITKEEIFNYIYAVLHNPAYITKYELNLKRNFPRIPFYEDFAQWSAWGKHLMDLHINYETVEPFDLKEITFNNIEKPKPKLKADKETGTIILDDATTLTGISTEAWQYKLGNRSALEWILDQYKEKKPTDPTIAEKFNTYRFADYKPQVIDLLKRVCTVSVETMKIINVMSKF